jgi:centrosomal protein CEP41
MTVDKVKFVSSQQFRKRQDEIFYRLKKEQLYSLFCEYEADDYEDIAENEISGCGPHIVTYAQDAKPTYEKPYLILDIRDQDEFREYRLLQSRSFPYTYLRQDRVHPELMNFKNKEAHLIIIVSRDDRMGADAAKILVDRGTDNVYLLSCAVSDFAEEYPAFAEGNVPAPKKSPSRTPSRSGTSSSSSSSYNQVKREMNGSVKGSARSGYSERATSGAATTLTSLRLPPEDKFSRRGGSHRSDSHSTCSNASSTGSGKLISASSNSHH